MCDDIAETVADLRARGASSPRRTGGPGLRLAVTMVLPGGLDVALYEPRHPTAI